MTSSPTDLDILMAHIAEINAKDPPLDPPDLANLIALYRRARAYRSDPAFKSRSRSPKAHSEPVVDIKALLGIGQKKLAPKALPASITPRPPGSIRRI